MLLRRLIKILNITDELQFIDIFNFIRELASKLNKFKILDFNNFLRIKL